MHHGSGRQLELFPRTIFRRAIEHGATGLILVHNHPSGDAPPSENDIVATRRLSDLGRSLDIEIVDHIVVTATHAQRAAASGRIGSVRAPACAHGLRDTPGSRSEEHTSAIHSPMSTSSSVFCLKKKKTTH